MKKVKSIHHGGHVPSLMRITKAIVVLAISIMLVATQACKKDETTIPTLNTDKYKSLNAAMRQLWTDHMQWTYATADAFFNNSGALSASLNRLLQNQKDIGAAIVPSSVPPPYLLHTSWVVQGYLERSWHQASKKKIICNNYSKMVRYQTKRPARPVI